MTRQLRELEVLEVLIGQGAVIPCKRCRVAFTMEDVKTGNIECEHLHEKALGGPDEPGNRAFSHKARPCHASVTHGPPATSAGSSRNRVAKANDPRRTEKFVVQKTAPQPPAPTPELLAPPARCRGCGGYPGECTCQPRPVRKAFARAR